MANPKLNNPVKPMTLQPSSTLKFPYSLPNFPFPPMSVRQTPTLLPQIPYSLPNSPFPPMSVRQTPTLLPQVPYSLPNPPFAPMPVKPSPKLLPQTPCSLPNSPFPQMSVRQSPKLLPQVPYSLSNSPFSPMPVKPSPKLLPQNPYSLPNPPFPPMPVKPSSKLLPQTPYSLPNYPFPFLPSWKQTSYPYFYGSPTPTFLAPFRQNSLAPFRQPFFMVPTYFSSNQNQSQISPPLRNPFGQLPYRGIPVYPFLNSNNMPYVIPSLTSVNALQMQPIGVTTPIQNRFHPKVPTMSALGFHSPLKAPLLPGNKPSISTTMPYPTAVPMQRILGGTASQSEMISSVLGTRQSEVRSPFLTQHLPLPAPFPFVAARLTNTPLDQSNYVFPWPYFAGVKRITLASVCAHAGTIISLGICSPYYLRCGSNALQYSFEECDPGQVFFNGYCQQPYSECVDMRLSRLNLETQYLLQGSNFCMQGEGAYVITSNQCSRQAIICRDYYNGFAISCTHDSVFSPVSLQCVPSTTICSPWQLTPDQFAPWKFFLINYYCQAATNPLNQLSSYNYNQYCRNWYVDCRAPVREMIVCENGQLYDTQTMRCRFPTQQDLCHLPPVRCSGKDWYNVGLGQCLGSFARCEGGFTRTYLCNEGFVFFNGQCVHPSLTENKCPVCIDGQTTQTKDAVCNQYLYCDQGRWVQRLCPDESGYSERLGICIPAPYCTRMSNLCEGREKIKISCNEFMECTWNGHYQRRACPLLHSWNVEKQRCIYDNTCLPKVMSTCVDGQLIDSWDCEHFFRCSKGVWIRQPCIKGVIQAGCQRCNSGMYQQRIGIQLECLNGTTRHDPNDCAYYGRCINNKWQRIFCANSLVWNQKQQRCMETSDCLPYRQAICKETERIAFFDPKRCDGYFECNRGSWSLFRCPTGFVFDTRVNRCILSTGGCPNSHLVPTRPVIRPPVSPPDTIGPISYYPIQNTTLPPNGCQLGSFLPDVFDCSRYYTCTSTGLIHSACLPNMRFNPAVRLCQKSYRCDITQCQDGQMLSGRVCGEYRKCVSGQWTYGQCPNNQYFEAGKCHPSVQQCGTLPQSACYNGQAIAVDNDCSNYLVCQNGIFQRRSCQNNALFDPAAKYCNPLYKCPYCKAGELRPDNDDCASYQICASGHFERMSCPQNQHFDKVKLICVPGACFIDVNNLGPCQEHPGHHGFRPHPTNPNAFLQCAQGRWVTRKCPATLVWSQSKLVCDWPTQRIFTNDLPLK